MKYCLVFSLLISLPTFSFAQEEVKVASENVDLYGTLIAPELKTNKAILIISGSGQTDRDGNTQPTYINNGLKKLAEELSSLGYATLRYDKRGVGKSISDSITAESLRFKQYAEDASLWISFLKENYDDITVIGHSQGALVGMIVIQNNKVDRFVSLAGLSEDAYTTIKRQLAGQPQVVVDNAYPILDSLKQGVKVDSVPQYLNSLFNPKLQDYFISFMEYDPREEIKKVSCPILVIQGTTDLQITVDGATEMSNESPYSTVKIIEGMNHVLRKSSLDANENMATYANPELLLHKDLLNEIENFIKQDNWYSKFIPLVGLWQVNGQAQFEEWYFDMAKKVFFGESYKMIDEKKQVSETLTIQKVNDNIIYTATVFNQNNSKGIDFKWNSKIFDRFSFENPEHDFPNKIQYNFTSENTIEAYVTGRGNNGFKLIMKKIEN